MPNEQIHARIAELQASLQQQLPGYKDMLHTIHRALQNDPETVHLLTDEEIGIICAGLAKRTDTVIATSAGTKNKLANGKNIKEFELDDIM